nr:M23 family metallopeptidase [Microbacterium testaceum]
MGYQRPVPYTRSTSWASHRRRNPPSSEPGIDMFCPIGTPVLAAEAGRIVDTGDSIGPATGRFVTIDLDDGHRVRYLHLKSRTVSVGQRVTRGQVIAYSGATGYGEEDWSWNVAETGGAHVHMTLWLTQRYIFGSNGTVDPEPYFDADGSPAGAGEATPIINLSEEDDMRIIYSQHLDRLYLIGDGGITHLVGDDVAKAYNAIGVPGNRFTNQLGKNDFRMVVEALGISYERTRVLKPGERLEKDTRTNVVENAVAVLDAGNVPWGPDWA